MNLKTLKDIADLQGKVVLLRVDFNVPMEDGKVQDDTRIRAALPTIKHLQEAQAKLVILSHLGRPKGEIKEELRLTEVAKHLETLINKPVKKLDETIGAEVKEHISKMQDGEIVVLENTRFHKEEKECQDDFTKELASLGDIFVSDAFGTAHRRHSSTAGLAEILPSYAGLLMEKEISALSPIINQEPEKPLTMIFGGAKIDTKIGLIQNFINKADYFLIGGGLANTFLHAAGHDVAASLYEADKKEIAQEIMLNAEKSEEQFVLPHDVTVADEISDEAPTLNVPVQDVSGDMKILDIGKQSAQKFAEVVAKSKTIIWNGPLGLCEIESFQHGSKTVAEKIAQTDCTSIIGGGDTADALKRLGLDTSKFTHISTGGGAAIEFLSGKPLPGITPLIKQ